MNVIVTDTGFQSIDTPVFYLDWHEVGADIGSVPSGAALDIPNVISADDLKPVLGRFGIIRIAFPSSADGRGFSIARHLRLLGFKKHLRAFGHILADQYAMARRSGFDDVEIDADLAKRQPQEQWRARADWAVNNYQSRLGRAV